MNWSPKRSGVQGVRPAGLPEATPFWPLGLPRWSDPWVALGLRAPGVSHLTVWRRGPDTGTGTSVPLPLPHLRGAQVTPRGAHPPHAGPAPAGTQQQARSPSRCPASRPPACCGLPVTRTGNVSRYAVVGTSARAGMYVGALAGAHAQDGVIVAWCDPNGVRMSYYDEVLAAAGLPPPARYQPGEFGTLLAKEQPDAVIVTSPDYTHPRYAAAALAAG